MMGAVVTMSRVIMGTATMVCRPKATATTLKSLLWRVHRAVYMYNVYYVVVWPPIMR